MCTKCTLTRSLGVNSMLSSCIEDCGMYEVRRVSSRVLVFVLCDSKMWERRNEFHWRNSENFEFYSRESKLKPEPRKSVGEFSVHKTKIFFVCKKTTQGSDDAFQLLA